MNRSNFANIVLSGMVLLTTWGIISIIYGRSAPKVPSATNRFCRQMTLYWGVINTVLGLSAIATVMRTFHAYQVSSTVQHRAHHLFQLNAGLDIVYITTGLMLAYVGKSVSDKRRGYGLAIVVQGIFLFTLDSTLALI